MQLWILYFVISFHIRYDVKYASNDALNTKRKYSHVQSKVKVYIDKLKKEDLESRKRRITRHRSEPSELAVWKAPDDNNVKFNDYTDWKLVQQEMVEMKSRMNELQSYGDTMSQLLSNERSKVSPHERFIKINLRFFLKISPKLLY